MSQPFTSQKTETNENNRFGNILVRGARDVRPCRQTGRLRFVLNNYLDDVENEGNCKKKPPTTTNKKLQRHDNNDGRYTERDC